MPFALDSFGRPIFLISNVDAIILLRGLHARDRSDRGDDDFARSLELFTKVEDD